MKISAFYQRGIAAIELALLMTATVFILVPTFVIAHALWQYTVLKQATDNAARYLAALPPYQLNSVDPDARDVARHMVARAVIDAGMVSPGNQAAFEGQIDVYCPGVVACRSKTPDTVVVGAYMTIVDPASLSLDGSPWMFQTISTVPYGN
jgi:Flp pilus assembly protein TadG